MKSMATWQSLITFTVYSLAKGNFKNLIPHNLPRIKYGAGSLRKRLLRSRSQ
jgi:hypothetical protein